MLIWAEPFIPLRVPKLFDLHADPYERADITSNTYYDWFLSKSYVIVEATGFNQWIKYWNFGHVFRHTPNALTAVFLLWTLAFNLLQLFVYRRLGRCRRPKDPTDTIRHIVEVMLRDVATLPEPIPWATLLLNTS